MNGIHATNTRRLALFLAGALLLGACGGDTKVQTAATQRAETTTTTPVTTTVADIQDEPTEPPVVAPDGYPFADATDIAAFEPWSITNSGAGDCWRAQKILVSEEMSIDSDEMTCGDYGLTNRYYLMLLDEVLRVHVQEMEADDAGPDEPPYFVTEQIYDFETVPAMMYERTGRAAYGGTLDTSYQATPIENPDAMINGLLALIDESGPDHYICYVEDAGAAPTLMAAFNQDDLAQWVKYEGQVSNIVVDLDAQTALGNTLIDTYLEVVDGQMNGTYTLTHDGNWDYVEYERPDGVTFTFTIDFDRSVSDQGGYVTSPCF